MVGFIQHTMGMTIILSIKQFCLWC